MPDYEDPGWDIAFRSLMPFVGVSIARSLSSKDGLSAIRVIFVALILGLILFVIAISYVAAWNGVDEGWVPWAVLLVGAICLFAVADVRRRPLNTADPQRLADSYRSAFFVGIGFAHVPALCGIVGVFVGGSLWIYLVGLPFALAGLGLIAPTRGNIERKQREVDATGSSLSLGQALVDSTPPGRN